MDGWNWAITFMGGGSLAGIALLISAVKDRKKIKAEAADRNLKSPAELDQLEATTRGIEIDNILKVNAAIAEGYAATQKELGGLREDVGAARRETGEVRERLGTLERIVREAHEFITHMLDLFEEHAPGVRVGKLPYGYRRPRRDEGKKE